MAKETQGNEKLNKSLKDANEAIKEMGSDARLSLSEDYAQVKKALSSTQVATRIAEVKEKSVEKVKEFGAQLDENVHSKPYHYIAGAAAAGLLLGILLGRKS